ncbi:hypothetical protein CANARDRAFT_9124 [[Candida] arabinofermentans NRRL YB-2248]|uniref:Pantoate--beta-alanine ligase n=1 Tax=[Candida] arabinofermentans NRRL YB-2248 TaxID=983967 RepID=A0A1E4SWG0_9ASCO|nr:hypothetical protein CANARDRAFT_9124 [[Candida] arabinofermentans NRRL YB-2248]
MTVSDIQVLTTVAELRAFRAECYSRNLTVGFVPTMGSLHQGHLTLVSSSLNENDITIVSIFVNPSQFAPSEDLDSYPRNLTGDLSLLDSVHGSQINSKGQTNTTSSTQNIKKVNCVFAPTVTEMYPSGIPLELDQQKGAFVSVLGPSEPLEGQSRPQFFRGVATVVNKLFNVTHPTRAYFGQKDIQQSIVIKRMVKDLLMGLEVRVIPTVRESTGLALSSRNAYLGEAEKVQAVVIYDSLTLVEKIYNEKCNSSTNTITIGELKSMVTSKIQEKNKDYMIDYVDFNDAETLDYLDGSKVVDPSRGAILSLAVKVPNDNNDLSKGFTRLIDNLVLPSTV